MLIGKRCQRHRRTVIFEVAPVEDILGSDMEVGIVECPLALLMTGFAPSELFTGRIAARRLLNGSISTASTEM